MPTNSANGSQYGTPIAKKKMPWNRADRAASTIFDTTYPPVLAMVISETVMNTRWARCGMPTARVRKKFGPSAAKSKPNTTMVTRSNSTADSEPTRPRTPPETVPAHDPTVDGVRWSDEEIVDASQCEPKLWLTHRIIEASTPGTLRTSAAIWVKNSLPKMIARRRAQAMALTPTIADAWPRDR